MSDFGAMLVSKLGSPDSKIPLGIKDSFNSLGFTYFSYDAGGSVEGKDRFVDEVGTGLIWLGGIPLYKKLIDKTVYNRAKVSAETDVRVVKDDVYLKEAIKNAPTEQIKNELIDSGNKLGKVKGLAIIKFLSAMALTMLSYLGLTKLKQNMTKLNIEKEFNARMQAETQNNQDRKYNNNSDIFNDIKNFPLNKNNRGIPSFGSCRAVKTAEEFMLNPIKNMILLDLGISSERLYNARTDGEFKEYAIKEGSFLFFVYCADRVIKKGLEDFSQKFLGMPISLDAKFLSSDLSSDILKDKGMQKEVNEFSENYLNNNDNGKLYKFLFENQNHTVVNAAKKSGIIQTVEDDKGHLKIDTRKYIDPDEIKKLTKNLQIYIKAGKSANEIKEFISKIRGLKIVSTALSIGACCLSLGYMVPKMIYEYRHKHQDGNRDFHVRTEYEKELAAKANKAA